MALQSMPHRAGPLVVRECSPLGTRGILTLDPPKVVLALGNYARGRLGGEVDNLERRGARVRSSRRGGREGKEGKEVSGGSGKLHCV